MYAPISDSFLSLPPDHVYCYECASLGVNATVRDHCRGNFLDLDDEIKIHYRKECTTGICKKWDYNIKNKTDANGDRLTGNDRLRKLP